MGVFGVNTVTANIRKEKRLSDECKESDITKFKDRVIRIKTEKQNVNIGINTKAFKKRRKIVCLVYDLECIIGDSIDRKTKTLDLTQLREKYLEPLISESIYVIGVIGSTEPQRWEDCKSDRELLKFEKNILKAFGNQSENEKIREIRDYFRKRDKSFDVQALSNNEKTKEKENIFGVKLLREIAYEHWLNHSTSKRLTEKMKKDTVRLFRNLGFPIVQAPGEADQWCALLYHLGIADFVVSKDTDMVAMGCDVIFDIYNVEKRINKEVVSTKTMIDVLYYKDLIEKYRKNGYTQDQINEAMCLSSADFNPVIYDKEYCFPKALSLIKREGSISKAMKFLCVQYERSFSEKTSMAIKNCYQLPFDQIPDLIKMLQENISTAVNPNICLILLQLTQHQRNFEWLQKFGKRLKNMLCVVQKDDLPSFSEYLYQIWLYIQHISFGYTDRNLMNKKTVA